MISASQEEWLTTFCTRLQVPNKKPLCSKSIPEMLLRSGRRAQLASVMTSTRFAGSSLKQNSTCTPNNIIFGRCGLPHLTLNDHGRCRVRLLNSSALNGIPKIFQEPKPEVRFINYTKCLTNCWGLDGPSYRKTQWKGWGASPPTFSSGLFRRKGPFRHPKSTISGQRPETGDKDKSWSSH